jgi:hypothetical protein
VVTLGDGETVHNAFFDRKCLSEEFLNRSNHL